MRLSVAAIALCWTLIGVSVADPADASIRRFTDIPAQGLGSALEALAKELDFQVLYRTEIVVGLQTKGAAGEFTTEEALRQLLEGTGLTFHFLGDRAVTIVPIATAPATLRSTDGPVANSSIALTDEARYTESSTSGALSRRLRLTRAQSAHLSASDTTNDPDAVDASGHEIDTVVVKSEKLPDAFSGGQVARGSRLGLLGNRDLMDTPFSTTGFTADFIQDVGARGLVQVITADPSVRLAGSETQTYDVFDIRGFTVGTEDISIDGLYGVAPWDQVAVETVERVELIKGPTSLLGGMSPIGSIGGSVNLAPKRAGANPLLQITGMFVSDSQLGTHLDMGRRFGSEQEFGIRLNGVYRNGDGALQGLAKRSEDATIGADYVKGGLQMTGDLGYQSRDYQGIDADSYLGEPYSGLPRVPDSDKRYLQPWIGMKEHSTYGVARAEYQFGPRVLAYLATGFGMTEGSYVLSYGTGLTPSGDFTENFWGRAFKVSALSTEAGIRTSLQTGVIEHQLALAATRTGSKSDQLFYFDNTIDGSAVVPPNTSNIYAPNILPAPDLQGFPKAPRIGEGTLSGMSLADTLSFSEGKVLLTVGARLQYVKYDDFDSVTGQRIGSYDEHAVSPSAGLVFRPTKSVSLYANYMEGLARGPTASAPALNAGKVFPPYASKQVEAGVKLDRGSFGTTFAIFQIARPQGQLNPDTLIFDLDGEQRHRGLEVSIFGEPLAGLRLLGGVMLLDPELKKTLDPANDGRRPDGVSKVNISLGGDWSTPILQGLAFSAHATYASSFYMNGSQFNGGIEAPGWTRIDLGSSYSFNTKDKPVTLRLNVENLFDKSYWASQYFYRGSPRTIVASATVTF